MVTNVLAERVVTKIQRRSTLSGIRPKTLRWTVLRSSTIFGSWPNALIAAGLEVPDSPHDGRRGVLPVLRDALEQHSANDLPEKLKLHAMYYLGSLRNAKAALKTKQRFRAGWSTTKIIAAICERRRLGNRSAIQQPDVITLLVSAAEAYLESWGNALHAAGIDPNLYLRRKCRKRTTLAKRDRLRL